MRHGIIYAAALAAAAAALFSAPQQQPGKPDRKAGSKKAAPPHPFYWAAPDPLRGDWQGRGGFVAQVTRGEDKLLSASNLSAEAAGYGTYQATVWKAFDVPNDRTVAVLEGVRSGDTVVFSGGGWTGSIEGGVFKARKGEEWFELRRADRTPPSLGAKPPAGAVVLFDGTNLDGWSKMMEKNWLTEDGPARWNLLPGGVLEAVPYAGSLISRKRFGDAVIHLEFRTLGGPTNSGVYIQDRYELNINETYGRQDGNSCAGFDNCTAVKPAVRCSRPPLEWQTLDIEFRAPRFDAAGSVTARARATVRFNGTVVYLNQELGPVTLSAARLGEAAAGPIQLQEHGAPLQFRNIWVVEGGSSR